MDLGRKRLADSNLQINAKKFSEYISKVWNKIQDDEIEDVQQVGENFRKCVNFFSVYIKHLPEYSESVMFMSRSILILTESKNLKWEVKYYAKLVTTCCLMMVFHKDEEAIRESCIVTKDVLGIVQREALDEIIQKYSSFLPYLLQRILTVHSRLTQAMILEVIFKLTVNSKNILKEALGNQKFVKRVNPSTLKELFQFFDSIDHENIEITSRGFLIVLNHYINPKTGIFTSEGNIAKVNDVIIKKCRNTYIDFNARANSVSFSVETRNICGSLKETNIHYSNSKSFAYFEATVDKIEMADRSNNELDVVVNIRNLMYKQDMNSALQEIDEIASISFVLNDDLEILADFKAFFEKFYVSRGENEETTDCNESLLSLGTNPSTTSIDGGVLKIGDSLEDVKGTSEKPIEDKTIEVPELIQMAVKKLQEPQKMSRNQEEESIAEKVPELRENTIPYWREMVRTGMRPPVKYAMPNDTHRNLVRDLLQKQEETKRAKEKLMAPKKEKVSATDSLESETKPSRRKLKYNASIEVSNDASMPQNKTKNVEKHQSDLNVSAHSSNDSLRIKRKRFTPDRYKDIPIKQEPKLPSKRASRKSLPQERNESYQDKATVCGQNIRKTNLSIYEMSDDEEKLPAYSAYVKMKRDKKKPPLFKGEVSKSGVYTFSKKSKEHQYGNTSFSSDDEINIYCQSEQSMIEGQIRSDYEAAQREKKRIEKEAMEEEKAQRQKEIKEKNKKKPVKKPRQAPVNPRKLMPPFDLSCYQSHTAQNELMTTCQEFNEVPQNISSRIIDNVEDTAQNEVMPKKRGRKPNSAKKTPATVKKTPAVKKTPDAVKKTAQNELMTTSQEYNEAPQNISSGIIDSVLENVEDIAQIEAMPKKRERKPISAKKTTAAVKKTPVVKKTPAAVKKTSVSKKKVADNNDNSFEKSKESLNTSRRTSVRKYKQLTMELLNNSNPIEKIVEQLPTDSNKRKSEGYDKFKHGIMNPSKRQKTENPLDTLENSPIPATVEQPLNLIINEQEAIVIQEQDEENDLPGIVKLSKLSSAQVSRYLALGTYELALVPIRNEFEP